ncbi:pyrroline-5-carboxylate reductase [Homoserinibacter sp. GY 40078]|uniref:pyrroline-5-carboxylate reductase n=1 Tax=Homoserinibacter sp. GY 40078 TaxID=2603275 RepID=UPI0011CB7575|nr:pyrroline-5-carboxylate reductase [Homoserinibacter sp. GY 40078]TXK18606.1 pyrroline-5-carboxylate reductase [Homoserinibacter sp. GY 40078]
MPTLPPLAVLGAGSMAGAILRGLLASGLDPASVVVTTRGASSAEHWRAEGVRALALDDDPEANSRAVDGAGVVLLGVKPAMVLGTLREVADALEPGAVVVSVAAGVTTASMESVVANPVVRTMPNTPALVRRAVTGVAAGSTAGEAELAIARELFTAVGAVVEVPEEQIDALSAISGSGPATFYFLVERLTETAERLGFDPSDARLLAEQTLIGSALLLESTGDEPRELRRRVTSPKGTTERLIGVLEEAELTELFERAAQAAIARAKELAAG